MEYQEFLNILQKRGSKPHTITHCYGGRDAWKWLRKNKWHKTKGTPIPQSLYSSIIAKTNQLLVEQMLEGHEIELPMRMGSLYLASVPGKAFYKDGKLQTNYRTDWLKTLQLWYNDEDARNAHTTIKRIQKDIVFIRYDKRKANYTNKRFYIFRANRSLVRKLGMALESNIIPVVHFDV